MNDKRVPTPYPIGTKIAEGYGLDLNREAALGLPGKRLGMRPPAEEDDAGSRRGALILAVLAVAVVAAWGWRLHGLSRSNFVATAYPDFRAAASQAAFQQGWVPRFLPTGATEIRDLHDVATGAGWLAFAFAPGEGHKLVAGLNRPSARTLEALRVAGPAADWWPAALRGRPAAGWDIYLTGRMIRGAGLVEYLAVDRRHGRAALWRESSRAN